MEVKTLLCDVEVVNKNPKYRIIKYNDEYLMIDLVSTWLTLFLPMMNWLIPNCLCVFRWLFNNAFKYVDDLKSSKYNRILSFVWYDCCFLYSKQVFNYR